MGGGLGGFDSQPISTHLVSSTGRAPTATTTCRRVQPAGAGQVRRRGDDRHIREWTLPRDRKQSDTTEPTLFQRNTPQKNTGTIEHFAGETGEYRTRTWMTRMTRMTWMTGMTRMTRMTRIPQELRSAHLSLKLPSLGHSLCFHEYAGGDLKLPRKAIPLRKAIANRPSLSLTLCLHLRDATSTCTHACVHTAAPLQRRCRSPILGIWHSLKVPFKRRSHRLKRLREPAARRRGGNSGPHVSA